MPLPPTSGKSQSPMSITFPSWISFPTHCTRFTRSIVIPTRHGAVRMLHSRHVRYYSTNIDIQRRYVPLKFEWKITR